MSTSSPPTPGSWAAPTRVRQPPRAQTHGRTRTCATSSTDETAVFIMSVFRRRVYEKIGGFDESFRSNEDYDFWIRAAVAGFRFVRNDKPAGYYRRRDDSLSADELRMLKGILRVYAKTRATILDRPAELAILDAQIERFETELVAAEARHALETGDRAAGAAIRPRASSAPGRCGSRSRQHDGEMGSGAPLVRVPRATVGILRNLTPHPALLLH